MPSDFEISPEQRDDFERLGLMRLPGFYPPAEIAGMAQRLWADLGRRFSVDPHRRETWTIERPAQFQQLERAGAFAAVHSPRLGALGDAFLGPGRWSAPKHREVPLVAFPTDGPWEAPHRHWHVDLPATGPALAALRLFTFLEPVRPRGGGTLVVSGSHRVAAALAREASPEKPVRSADLKAALARADPWFAALMAPAGGDRVRRFMEEGALVRGTRVRVEEMTGEPGDLIVMHPAILHALAPNVLDRPRLMLTMTLSAIGAGC